MIENLTKDVFAESLNTRFQLGEVQGRALELELVEVNSDERMRDEGVESFSIVFRGPADLYLPQGIYRMEHGRTGSCEIFIVPIKRDGEGFYYEAVFNRLTR